MISVTVSMIKDRTVGLDQWYAAAAKSQSLYDDAKITSLIPGWLRQFERETQIRLHPVQVVSAPDGSYGEATPATGTLSAQGALITGVGTHFTTLEEGNQIVVGNIQIPIASIEDDLHLTLDRTAPRWSGVAFGTLSYPTIRENGYPYFVSDGDEFFVTTLQNRPVRQVQRMRLMLNGTLRIYEPPTDWFSLNGQTGRFWLLPIHGSAVISNASAAAVASGIALWEHIPNFLFFDYVAGLPEDWEWTQEWSDLPIKLSEFCALQVLKDISQAIGAGQTGKQTQLLGGSQSMNYERFMGRKQELTDSYTAYQELLKAQESPLMMSYI